MNKQKELVEKALNYIELIEQSKRFQKGNSDILGMYKFNDFLNLRDFHKKRIPIHDKIQKRLQNRVNNLLKQAIKNDTKKVNTET